VTKPKLESDFKKKMVDDVNANGGYATRVEDQYRVGLLDLIFATPKTGLILAEAKRFSTTFFEPSPRQYIEMCRVDNGGGVALLIGVHIKTGIHYLHHTNLADHPRGRVEMKNCVAQQPGESFTQTLERWCKETIHVR
jgi:hypothetical protein